MMILKMQLKYLLGDRIKIQRKSKPFVSFIFIFFISFLLIDLFQSKKNFKLALDKTFRLSLFEFFLASKMHNNFFVKVKQVRSVIVPCNNSSYYTEQTEVKAHTNICTGRNKILTSKFYRCHILIRKQNMARHTGTSLYNFSTWKAEAGGSQV